MKISSWNVNGLRACLQKRFAEWLEASEASIVGLQEVRATAEQLERAGCRFEGWHTSYLAAEKAGYSGVGLLSRQAPDEVLTSLGDPDFDREGRAQITRFGTLTVVNAYFPNGNGTPLPGGRRSNDRIPYKLAFYRRIFELLSPRVEAGERVLVLGDFNTAHEAIDLARPKANTRTSGFRPEEREELDRWLRAGWTDTFRHFHPGVEGRYSWWSQRFGVREKNLGWRIDYVLASPAALRFVQHAFIDAHVLGSDHAPVGVVVDPAILR